jgi:RNA polymerase I-specific transcription initiation factor RRN7
MIVYHGEEGEWLKLQALQLMLRLQVHKIREIWQLPEVFEVSFSDMKVVRADP